MLPCQKITIATAVICSATLTPKLCVGAPPWWPGSQGLGAIHENYQTTAKVLTSQKRVHLSRFNFLLVPQSNAACKIYRFNSVCIQSFKRKQISIISLAPQPNMQMKFKIECNCRCILQLNCSDSECRLSRNEEMYFLHDLFFHLERLIVSPSNGFREEIEPHSKPA